MPGAGPSGFLVFSGYNLRAVVAFCRALHRAQRPFRIVACTAADPIFQTRWARHVAVTRRSTALDPVEITAGIAAAGKAAGIATWAIVPSSEYFVRWCLDHRDALERAGARLPLPSREIYHRISDKEPFTRFCRECGLAVPAEYRAFPPALPAVAKPRANVTPDGRSLYPVLLRTAEELARFQATERPEEYFFQEFVAGESVYLLLHVARGGAVSRFSQRNLVQQPGGKSILLAEPAAFHDTPPAGRWAEAVRAVGFHGLVMLEFRLRPSGEAVLIEANPRLWGPLQLLVDNRPEVLDAYFDDVLGPSAQVPAPAARSRSYLWLGGYRQSRRQGGDIAWHPPASRRGWGFLLRHLSSEVFLRRDTWRLFLRELGSRSAAEPPISP